MCLHNPIAIIAIGWLSRLIDLDLAHVVNSHVIAIRPRAGLAPGAHFPDATCLNIAPEFSNHPQTFRMETTRGLKILETVRREFSIFNFQARPIFFKTHFFIFFNGWV